MKMIKHLITRGYSDVDILAMIFCSYDDMTTEERTELSSLSEVLDHSISEDLKGLAEQFRKDKESHYNSINKKEAFTKLINDIYKLAEEFKKSTEEDLWNQYEKLLTKTKAGGK